MGQQDLEQRLISVATDEKVFGDVLTKGIDSEAFIIHTEVFDFIQKYYFKYNSIPSKAIIESTFPGFSYVDDVKPQETKYLCDELIKSVVKRKAITIINDSSELLTVDTYGAIDSLIGKLSNIRKTSAQSRSFADADALLRYEKVVKNKNRVSKGATIGIKTGISFFDEQYIGWQPGNLIGVVGRLKVGKSSVAQYMACQAYLTGKRILFLSPEMSVDEVNFKFDTFMGKMMGHSFANDKLQSGEVDLKQYKAWLEELSKRKDWLTLDGVNGKKFNIGNITALVNEFSPDLMVVDGVALLDDSAEQSWVKVMNISYGLKSIAQNYKIVIIATSQANRTAGNEMPRTDQVSYGDAFMQAVDVGIMLQSDINKPNIRYATIPAMRGRAAINTPLEIRFDINEGVISM